MAPHAREGLARARRGRTSTLAVLPATLRASSFSRLSAFSANPCPGGRVHSPPSVDPGPAAAAAALGAAPPRSAAEAAGAPAAGFRSAGGLAGDVNGDLPGAGQTHSPQAQRQERFFSHRDRAIRGRT